MPRNIELFEAMTYAKREELRYHNGDWRKKYGYPKVLIAEYSFICVIFSA